MNVCMLCKDNDDYQGLCHQNKLKTHYCSKKLLKFGFEGFSLSRGMKC